MNEYMCVKKKGWLAKPSVCHVYIYLLPVELGSQSLRKRITASWWAAICRHVTKCNETLCGHSAAKQSGLLSGGEPLVPFLVLLLMWKCSHVYIACTLIKRFTQLLLILWHLGSCSLLQPLRACRTWLQAFVRTRRKPIGYRILRADVLDWSFLQASLFFCIEGF